MILKGIEAPKMVSYALSLGLLSTMLTVGSVVAAEKTVGYLGRDDVNAFIDDMVETENFDRKTVEAMLGQAQRSDRILELMSKPAESVMEWGRYRSIFMTPERIEKGVAFWKQNAKTLAAAEATYGVPASVMVAIIGVETYYGRQTGGFEVIDALATLGFDYPRRGEFFRKELKNFLVLVREQKLSLNELTGSYAGAMGMPQFMPSSYRAYAVDFSKDGQVDIWKNQADAIASVGNYLKVHGWQAGEPIAMQFEVTGNQYTTVLNRKLDLNTTVGAAAKAGWDIPSYLAKETKVLAMQQNNKSGAEYWLGFKNFEVITRYNRSQMYALAVYQLADAVKQGFDYEQLISAR